MSNIRPRTGKSLRKKVTIDITDNTLHKVNVQIRYKCAPPAMGFPHQVVKKLLKEAVKQGYVNQRGTPDMKRLAKESDVSTRMLFYASRGGNISIRAIDQLADVLGYELYARPRGGTG